MRARGGFDIRERAGMILVLMLVWLGVLVAVNLMVNLPRADRISALEEAHREFGQHLAERKRKVSLLRAEYDRVMDGRRTLQTFYDEVLSTKRERMTTVQREIRQIAGKWNINPETISYQRDVFEEDRIVKFSLVVPLDGSYENLRAFVSAVENSENFLTIESIGLSDSKEGGVILSLNVTLVTYFLDPDIQPKERAAAGRT
jgi:Tfp pilus assembly protein PilO